MSTGRYCSALLLILTLVLPFHLRGQTGYDGYIHFRLLDANTGEDIQQTQGAIIQVTWEIYKREGKKVPFADGWAYQGLDSPVKIGQHSDSKMYPGHEIELGPGYDSHGNVFEGVYRIESFNILVKAKGYEDYKTNEQISDGEAPHITAYLVAKKQVIDATVDMTTKSRPDLGVLSTAEIAKELGIPETEIVKLVLEKKLKARKIGEKYFIKKDDFVKYMNSQ